MRVGFTGTRYGMTPGQNYELCKELNRLLKPVNIEENWFHFGDCIGADAEAAAAARYYGFQLYCHPPSSSEGRVHVKSDFYETPLPHLKRNRMIVAASQVLIAAPYTKEEVLRSGTWATIRYARSAGKPIIMLYP